MKKSKATASKIKKQDRLGAEELRAIAFHERQSTIDGNEISNTYKEKDMYASLAMK